LELSLSSAQPDDAIPLLGGGGIKRGQLKNFGKRGSTLRFVCKNREVEGKKGKKRVKTTELIVQVMGASVHRALQEKKKKKKTSVWAVAK